MILDDFGLPSCLVHIFTDGLSESIDKDKEELGIEGAKIIINNNFNSSMEDELNNISKEVKENSAKDKLDDDLTILTIGR